MTFISVDVCACVVFHRSVYTFSWIFRQRFFLFCIGFRQLLNASLWEGKTHSAQFKTHRRIHDAICVNVFISTFLFITQRSASRFQFSRINCFSLCNFHIIRWFLIFSVCVDISHTLTSGLKWSSYSTSTLLAVSLHASDFGYNWYIEYVCGVWFMSFAYELEQHVHPQNANDYI